MRSSCQPSLPMRSLKVGEFLLIAALVGNGGDAVAQATSKAGSVGPTPISVEDFVVDKSTLIGKTVAVAGSAYCLNGELCYLSAEGSPMTNVIFNIEKLKREDRKRLLGCNPYSNPCSATVFGRAGNELLAGIKADSIVFEPTEEDRAAADPALPACDTVSVGELKELAEQSPLGRMMHLQVEDVKVHTELDGAGHKHCTAYVLTSGGQKSLKYYFRMNGNRIGIVGAWKT